MTDESNTPPKPPAPDARDAGARPKPASPPAKAAAAPKPPPGTPTEPTDPDAPDDVPVPPFITELRGAIPEAIAQVTYWVGDWTVIADTARLADVATWLRDAAGASFDYCSDITASDWPARERRFDVIYCLYSTRHRHRVRIKVRAGADEPVPSVVEVWPAANWLEREVYDMFGVNFVGHPDRRRILMPDEWQGHPQRKDYPLEGPGEFLMENPLDWLRLRNAEAEAEIE